MLFSFIQRQAGATVLKGSTDASSNPNYPVALAGDTYLITVAGKVGGGSGKTVEAGDTVVAMAANAGGTEDSVGTSWVVIQGNVAFTPAGLTLATAATAAAQRSALGVDTADSPQLAGINLGDAADTTLTRLSAGNVAVEGNLLYRAGGTDVEVSDGGTGSSSSTDLTSVWISDSFLGGGDTTGTHGDLGWASHSIRGTFAGRHGVDSTQFGSQSVVTGATRRNASALSLIYNGGTGAFPLAHSSFNTSTQIAFKFKINELTTGVRLGYMPQATSGAVSSPTRFIGVVYVPVSPTWAALTAYTTGDYVQPVTPNGRRYYASTGGTSAAGEPVWPTTPAGTVADGSVTWTEDGRAGNANFQLQARQETDETTADVSVTSVVADTNYHTIVIRYGGSNTWKLSLDGAAEVTLTKTPSGTFSIGVTVETYVAAAGTLILSNFRGYSNQ